MIYYGKPIQRKIIFDGNSLTAMGGAALNNGQRYAQTCYSSIINTSNIKNLTYLNYGVNSKRTDELITDFTTKIGPYVNKNDIIIFWEITNAARSNPSQTDGTFLYNQVVTYCQQALSYGAIVVALTGIARNNVAEADPTITARIQACNSLMVATPPCNLVIDVGALTQFNDSTDPANTTYYHTDRIHLTDTGFDLIASTVYSALVSSGLLS